MSIRRTTGMILLCALTLSAGEVLDRIAATVNGHAILQSDWDQEVRYESFMSGRPSQQVTGEAQKSALDHLIDQELLREQVSAPEVSQVSPEEVEKQLHSLRGDYLREHGLALEEALSKPGIGAFDDVAVRTHALKCRPLRAGLPGPLVAEPERG